WCSLFIYFPLSEKNFTLAYKTPFPGNAVTVPEFSAGEDLFLSQIQNQKQQSISVNQQITGGFYPWTNRPVNF
ncbi:hypothetical protein, partial [[Ruminococcus] lactaris]|uniref:hypothetical protein n=1 Tax=[Ruminococcus] lactaris TaxID=46228 RepID=UPI002674882A